MKRRKDEGFVVDMGKIKMAGQGEDLEALGVDVYDQVDFEKGPSFLEMYFCFIHMYVSYLMKMTLRKSERFITNLIIRQTFL